MDEAVRDNPDKFPPHYMFEQAKSVLFDLRSKNSFTKVSTKSHTATKYSLRDDCICWQQSCIASVLLPSPLLSSKSLLKFGN